MVHRSAQSSEIKNKHKQDRKVRILLDILTFILVAGATYTIFRLTAVKPENRESNNPDVVNRIQIDDDEGENLIWLNRTLRSWMGTFSRDFSASVEIYDLDKEEIVGEVSPEMIFTGHVASEIGAKFNMSFTTSGQTSARELTEILKVAFKHGGIDDEDWAEYKATLLEQPEIYSEDRCYGYCKTRDGLPAGFTSEQVKVYNENFMDTNGSFFEIYRDVAIAEFNLGGNKTRSFAIALIARGFSSQDDFKRLGEMLEKVILAHVKDEV